MTNSHQLGVNFHFHAKRNPNTALKWQIQKQNILKLQNEEWECEHILIVLPMPLGCVSIEENRCEKNYRPI